ncbi:hypothetical protein [Paracoccus yeei]|uniref:Uncharacterized protein n=1 Tax=Paracoccus yeei TaxID=147645 RepID=A0A386UHK3_9RHOB|nr:hypothetical protein [Paracoccus yeei]AYE99857.1 hypothetical protein PY32053_00159 [Paracoccus yeei]
MAANFNVCLNEDAKTGDIIRYLEQAVNDDDLAKIVSDIDMQGKSLFGPFFRLRFDRTIRSRDFRRRVFLTRPRAKQS